MLDIFKTLKLENFSDEEKAKIVTQIAEPLSKRIMLYAYEHLSETDRVEFESLAQENNETKISKFLDAKLPGLNQIISIETLKIIEEIKKKPTPETQP